MPNAKNMYRLSKMLEAYSEKGILSGPLAMLCETRFDAFSDELTVICDGFEMTTPVGPFKAMTVREAMDRLDKMLALASSVYVTRVAR